MPTLKILIFPDPRLRTVATAVSSVDEKIKAIELNKILQPKLSLYEPHKVFSRSFANNKNNTLSRFYSQMMSNKIKIDYENEKNIISAIIFENKIDFRTEPNYRSDILFNLHEGTKVIVKEELNEWTLIQISDGSTGWIESQSIKKID